MLTVTTEVILGSARRVYELSGAAVRIGRDADCELVLMLSWLEGCVAILEPVVDGVTDGAGTVRLRVPDGVRGRVEVGGVWVAADHSTVCQLPVMARFSGPVPGQSVEVQLVSATVPPGAVPQSAATPGRLAAAVEAADRGLAKPPESDWRDTPGTVSRAVPPSTSARRGSGFWISATCTAAAFLLIGFLIAKATGRPVNAPVPGPTATRINSEPTNATAGAADTTALNEELLQIRTERKRLEQMLARANADLETTRTQLDRRNADLTREDQTIIDLRTQLARRSDSAGTPSPLPEPPIVKPASIDPALAARSVAAAEEARQARVTEEFLQATNIKTTPEAAKAWATATDGMKVRLTGGLLKLPTMEDPLVWVVKSQSGVILVRGYADEYSSSGVPLRYFFLARVKPGTSIGGQELMSLELID